MTKMTKYLHIYCLCAIVSLWSIKTYSSEKTSFQVAYDNYVEILQKSVSTGDKDAVVPAAKLAFDEGFKAFGAESKNTSLLAKNYADALIAANRKKEAVEVLKDALVYYKAAFGDRSNEVKVIFQELLGLMASIPEDNSEILKQAMLPFTRVLDETEQKYNFGIAEFYTELADSYIRYKIYDRAIVELEKAREIHKRLSVYDDKWIMAIDDKIFWLKNLDGKDWLNLEDVRYTYKTRGNSLNKEKYAYLIKNYFLELKNNLYQRTALDVLKEENSTVEEIYKDNEERLLNAYIELAKNLAVVLTDIEDHLEKATTLAEKIYEPNSFEYAKVKLRVADIKRIHALRRESLSDAKTGIDIISKLPVSLDTNAEMAFANYILGEVNSSQKNLKAAIAYFDKALEYEKAVQVELNPRIELIHRKIITEYERVDRAGLATPYCVELGSIYARRGKAEPVVIVGTTAKYPGKAYRKKLAGEVKVEFTVTKEGYVKDPILVEASDDIFVKSAMRAISEFRYAPRVIDGKPVDTQNVTQKFVFRAPE